MTLRKYMRIALALLATAALLTATVAATSFTAETKTVDAGTDSVTVEISLADNEGLAGALLSVSYDSALTLTAVNGGTALSTLQFTAGGDLTEKPFKLLWDGLEADSTNGTVAVLTFSVPETAGEYAIELSGNDVDFYDGTLTLAPVTLTGGKITVASASTHVPGDIDGNGTVNMRDLLTLRQALAGGYGVDVSVEVGDLDHNGSVNMRDLLTLRQYLAGGYGIVLT